MATCRCPISTTRRLFAMVLGLSFFLTASMMIGLFNGATIKRTIFPFFNGRAEESDVAVTQETNSVSLDWNERTRQIEIWERFNLYFSFSLQLLPSRQVPLSEERRVRMIDDYFESKRRVYLPSTPRGTRPEFLVYPVDRPRLPKATFSAFQPLLSDDSSTLLCFVAGTIMAASLEQRRCVCAPKWRGQHCSVPSMTISSSLDGSLRQHPRRVVYAMGVSHEIEHMILTLSLLWDVVDLFVIGEMNMTQYGDPRPRFILELLQARVFEQYETKIFYIPCSFPQPKRCREHDSYLCDDFKYDCLQQSGIGSIDGLDPDDLIMYTDADELVPPELVHAVRYHETDYRHFAININWFVYGCAWRHLRGSHVLSFGATVDFVRNHSILTMRGRRGLPEPLLLLNSRPQGLHCSWCFDVAGIQLKLISAVNSDYPRWGDYAAMVDADLIKFLISRGTFFNLQEVLVPVEWNSLKDEPFRNASHCSRFIYRQSQRIT